MLTSQPSAVTKAVEALHHRLAAGLLPRRRAVLIAIAVALVASVIELGVVSKSFGDPGTPSTMLTVALAVLSGLPLLFFRRAPLVVLAATLLIEAVLVYIDTYPGGAPVLISLGTVAMLEHRRRSLPTLVVTALVLQLGSVSSVPVSVLAWAVGAYAQTRMRYTESLIQWTAQLERERDQLNEIAAQRERTAIARELHDIVAHSVTVMLLGVRGARDTLRYDPDLAEEALRRVEVSAEESIDELRRILVVLRSPTSVANQEPHPLAPAPTLERIKDLVRDRQDAGMPVTLRVTGPARSLPPGVEVSVYRIVQEALTNVLKHAAQADKVEVGLDFRQDGIEVMVTDDGHPRHAGAAERSNVGHGLLGLRERVDALRGELQAGPQPQGGFRLRVTLPDPTPQSDA